MPRPTAIGASSCATRNGRGSALAGFERCLAIKPDHAEAWNNLGLALHETGRPDEASAAIGRAIALRPGYAEAHDNLGIALHAQGRLDPALAVQLPCART